MILLASGLLSTGLFAFSALAAAPAQDPLILHADAVVQEDGSLLRDGKVLIRGERILVIGSSVPRPAGARLHRVAGVLAPGIVDAFSGAGSAGAVGETARRANPMLRAADALDLEHEHWSAALARGITMVHSVPDPSRVVAGWSARVRSGGSERILSSRGRAIYSLVPGEFNDLVLGPSALPGGLQLLAADLAAGRPGLEERGAVLYVDGEAAVAGARAAFAEQDAALAWIAWGDVGSYGGVLAGELVGLPVVHDGDWTPRLIETWRRLHQSGARVAFGTRGPEGGEALDALRATAMAYARATNDPDAALAAITSHAAELAGAAPGSGRLAPGAPADLVLWSAHPLDAAARVRAVMIGGKTVYAAPASEEE